uniref:Urotensin 2 n=1 Tax=Crocodylus porosus TaxID=8502 RepID=A0A7M4EXK4_CROPO
MHRLVFCWLIIISLSCPLSSLPIRDFSEMSYQLSAEDDNSKLTLERLDALGRASLLQTLQGLLDAQNEDSKTGRTDLPYLHGHTPGALYGSHPRLALLSRLLAKERKQYKKRGNLSECFWKYCV